MDKLLQQENALRTHHRLPRAMHWYINMYKDRLESILNPQQLSDHKNHQSKHFWCCNFI